MTADLLVPLLLLPLVPHLVGAGARRRRAATVVRRITERRGPPSPVARRGRGPSAWPALVTHPLRAWRSARQRARLATQWPLVTDGVARALRSGRTLPDALVVVTGTAPAPVSDHLGPVLHRLAHGASMAEAVEPWRHPDAGREASRMATLLCLGAELGAGLATAFASMAAAQRDLLDLTAEVRSLTAQSQASARLLIALPPLAALGLGAIEPASLTFLLGDPAGWVCLLAAGLLDGCGWWWMRSLVGAVA